jgi:hypothetical protein
MVSDGLKPPLTLDLFDFVIALYRRFYRHKTSVFADAGDGLGLTGGYSSPSIVNYRCGPANLIL